MGKIFSNLDHLPEFDKDLKKLLKRFKTLEDDLETFIKTELNLYHKLNIDNNGIFEISGLGIENPRIYKAKKFACKSLKGKGVKSGIRVIYAYYDEIDSIELVEMYYKGDKANEDRNRIKEKYKL
jgi:mRNA-degrading endonuclease RelE of RelBE toxin-antitoxin system